MSRCEFYPDGAHHFVKDFWGWRCDRCGRLSLVDLDEPVDVESELV